MERDTTQYSCVYYAHIHHRHYPNDSAAFRNPCFCVFWGHVEKNFSCNWGISNSSRDYDGKAHRSIHFIFLTHIDQTNWSSLNRRYFYLWNCFDICIVTCAIKLKGMASTFHPSKKIQMPLHQPKINMCFETMEFMISLPMCFFGQCQSNWSVMWWLNWNSNEWFEKYSWLYFML